MLKRLIALEKKFNTLENGVSSNMIEMGKVADQVKRLEQNVDTQNIRIEAVAQQKADKSDHHDQCSSDSNEDGYESSSDESDDASSGEEDVVSPEMGSASAGTISGADAEGDASGAQSVSLTIADSNTRSANSDGLEASSVQSGLVADRGVAVSMEKHKTDTDGGVSGHTPLATEGTSSKSTVKKRKPGPHHASRHARSSNSGSHNDVVRSKDVVVGNSSRSLGQWSRPLKFEQSDNNGFTVPRSQRRKQQRSSRRLFIFNVPNQCSKKNIDKYVSAEKIKVLELFQSSHPEARRKSFVLQVAYFDYKKLLNSNFWPRGVKVREYVEKSVQ